MEKYGFRQIKQKTKSHCEKRNEKMEVFFYMGRFWTKKTKTFKKDYNRLRHVGHLYFVFSLSHIYQNLVKDEKTFGDRGSGL